ncbi:hypothetical protein HYN46_15490 [Aquirhabdus parva]|uniref:Uncharacterized protein n=1 Tax=Aquirhabdus parva TaxID=2283318 RepID=A0A345PA08_9GAMM|nr:hypothetical protein HYN46_15490 [Aquirhabdus parva]
MDNLVEFQCLSCDAIHHEKLTQILLNKSYLFCSICPSCGQVIGSETKGAQLEDYLNTHFVLNDTATNLPDAFQQITSGSYKRRAAH